MDDLLWPQVLAAFGVDASLSVLCGLMLSGLWLEDVYVSHDDIRGRNAVQIRFFAGLLVVALCAQLMLLAISFTGQTSLPIVLASMPDVCSTHAGAFSLALCGIAVALCLATWLPSLQPQTTIRGLLVAGALCLHAATGHAVSNGNFSLAELLQLIHLFGMAVWSGGVIVSGLSIVPRLQRRAADEAVEQEREPTQGLTASYLGRLSLTSTWAVSAVIASGLVKAYIATGASVPVILSSSWGQILTIKTAFVAFTFFLGARNRWLLTSARRQAPASVRSAARTLRLEAISMLAVLLLSAWLASSQPPLE